MEISLEQVKNDPNTMKIWKNKTVRIFSGEHDMYWRPGSAGYTPDGLQAGVWQFCDAYKRTRHCDPTKAIRFRSA